MNQKIVFIFCVLIVCISACKAPRKTIEHKIMASIINHSFLVKSVADSFYQVTYTAILTQENDQNSSLPPVTSKIDSRVFNKVKFDRKYGFHAKNEKVDNQIMYRHGDEEYTLTPGEYLVEFKLHEIDSQTVNITGVMYTPRMNDMASLIKNEFNHFTFNAPKGKQTRFLQKRWIPKDVDSAPLFQLMRAQYSETFQ